jgi:dipeptidyl aminopeptidase/acylaminoacyl peptidase
MIKWLLLLSVFLYCADVSFAQSVVSLAPYLSVRGAGAPAISPDGNWITFGNSVSGTSQLWKLPASAPDHFDAYWPDQLTFFPDGVGNSEWSPDNKQILFSKDVGGNENAQLYLINADGSGLDTLTNNPKAMFAGGFARDGKHILYRSNERFYDIYLLDLRTRTKKLLHQSDHQNRLIGMTHDMRYVFFARDSGNADNYVYMQDVTLNTPNAEPILLTPHTVEANYEGFHITHDGKRLYFFTNQDQEFMSRAFIDLTKPNAPVVFRDHAKWDIDQDHFSGNDKIEVVTRDADGISEVKIFEVATGAVLPGPALPEPGFISNMQVSHDGSKLAFNFTGPKTLSRIYVFDRAKNTTVAITKPNFAGLDPKAFVGSELIHYPSFDGAMIPAYYYKAKGSGRKPVIVMMHGGPESQERPTFNPIAQYYVQRGYSILIPNVRGSTGYGKAYADADNTTKRMTSVRDMEYAGRWLKILPTIDSTKLVIFGGSYGGFMSLAAMTMQPDLWAAGVDLFGIANFQSFLRNTSAYRARNRMAEYGDIDKDSAFLVEISPLTHVSAIKHPLFVYQGKNDPRVPYTEAEQIVSAVKAKGIPVEYILLPDEGHGLSKRENRTKVYTAIVEFLDRQLK